MERYCEFVQCFRIVEKLIGLLCQHKLTEKRRGLYIVRGTRGLPVTHVEAFSSSYTGAVTDIVVETV